MTVNDRLFSSVLKYFIHIMIMMMRRNLLMILLLGAALATVIDATVLKPKTREGFSHLGSMKRSKVVTGMGFTEDWDYWASVNAVGYSEAKRECQANGDTLLYIETREELGNVTRFLQDTDNIGHPWNLYWTGGRYDVDTEQFKWDNGVPFGSEAAWGDDQPQDRKVNTRVALDARGREVKLITQPSTLAMLYICEGERTE